MNMFVVATLIYSPRVLVNTYFVCPGHDGASHTQSKFAIAPVAASRTQNIIMVLVTLLFDAGFLHVDNVIRVSIPVRDEHYYPVLLGFVAGSGMELIRIERDEIPCLHGDRGAGCINR